MKNFGPSFGIRLALVLSAALGCLAGSFATAQAQTNPAVQSLPYTQDFGALLHTSTTYPAGWQGWNFGASSVTSAFRTAASTGDGALTASGDASGATGANYNYNGKIGFLDSGSYDGSVTLAINTLGKGSISVSFDAATIRNPYNGGTNTRINEMILQYRAGTLGAFTNVLGTEYQNNTTTQTGAGVTTPQNPVTKSITLPAACDNQAILQLRWTARDVSGGGSRPSFSVDNVSVTGTALPTMPDLLARWSLDGNVNDSSGNGIHGSTVAAPSFVTGIEGTQALGLNGTSQYATVPHNALLNASSQITLAAWIRPNVNGTQTVITKAINGTAPAGINGYELALQTGAGGKVFFRLNQASSADAFRLNSATAYPIGGATWMHVAATYDGATAKIYVNGVLDASAAMVTTIPTNAVGLGIGSQFDGTGARFLNGSIDDARVYSRALSASEVADLASHTLTLNATNGSISPSPNQALYPHNSLVNLTPVPATGYHFVNWSGDASGSANPLAVTMSANKSITANFAINTYTLSTSVVGSGSVAATPPQATYDHGSLVSLQANPSPGWHFVSWSGDASGSSNPLSVTMDGDKSITATFAEDRYTLTVSTAGTGSGSVAKVPDDPDYASGSIVQLTANPAAGSTFTGWSGDATGTTNPLDVTMSGNKSITATFTLNTYTISASAGSGGSIAPSGAVLVNYGDDPSFTITADPGYAIADVLVDAVSVGAVSSYAFTDVAANHTIAASFVAIGNTIDAVSPAGKVTLATPTVTVPVTITRGSATPNVMAFSVKFTASSPLMLPAGRFSITLPPGGGFLNADGGRNVSLQTIDLGGGSYQADGAILGTPCGSSALTGTLFNVAVSSAAAGGSGTITVTSVTLRDCLNAAIPASIGTTATVDVNQSAPSVTVTAPNGGETYPVGSTQSISWSASDPEGVASVDLAYSTDGGATYPNSIATGLPNSGSYAWLVPNTFSTTARVRATAHDVDDNTAADASDANFTIGCPTITVNGAVTPVACFGGTNGAIDVSVSGGAAPYTYLWGDGPTSEDRSGLSAGSYSVTVTDANGCVGVNSFNVGEPAELVASETHVNVACFGGATGSIDVSVAGGTSPYSYAWSDGPTTQDRSGLAAGSYSLTVTDANGCTDLVSVTITEPAELVASETHVNVACFGGATGSIDVSVVGGTPGYTYAWADGPTTQDRSGLAAGSYSLTVTDANGCTDLVSVTITEPAELVASETHAPTCLGTPDGSIDVTVTGGTAPYSYAWSDGPTTEDRSGLAAGNYSLTVTDANGCTDGVSVTIVLRTYVITATAGSNGSIAPSGAVTVNCGADQSFTITADVGYHVDDVVVDAVSQGPQGAWTFTNVQTNHTIDVTFAANPTVAPVANLDAQQQRTGNPAGSTTNVALTWNAVPIGVTVEVWRAPYGHYPQYDDAGGAEPTPSATYPPGAGWTLTGVTSSGGLDLPTTRDFYYYVAYAKDAYGTYSVASNRTNGTLNYHLGDVSDGITAGVGNNLVQTEDISLLGAHYGLAGGALSSFQYLDVGPTTTGYIEGRPTTDGRTDFEDLVIFAVNYHEVSRPLPVPPSGELRIDETIVFSAPERVSLGSPVTVDVVLQGSGALRALSTRLGWDASVVEPVAQAAGDWLSQLGGVAFTPALGTIDAAVFSKAGMAGDGTLATVTFRVLAAGDPKFRIASVDGRDARNRGVEVNVVATPVPAPATPPAATSLAFARPNPFLDATTIAFSLSRGGPVELSIYSVDGRKLRTLARETREPGEYSVIWDGREDSGARVSAGVYYVRLVTPEGRFVRATTRLR